MNQNIQRTFIGFTLLTVLLAVPGFGFGFGRSADNGFLIGIMAPYNAFAGDFDGDHFFNAGEEFLYVPEMEKALGWGLMIGSRKQGMDWELYYMRSSHNASFLDIHDKAGFDAVGANSRFFLGRGMFRPFFNMGMDFCWIKAPHFSETAYTPYRSGNAKFTGLGLFAGLGLAVTPIRSLTFFVGGELRWSLFGRGKGVLNESYKLDNCDSLSICIRSGLYFLL